MHSRQQELNGQWAAKGLAPFGLGIGLSTGEVAAALLGSAERLEYTLVGDTVNLAQRLQDLARPAGSTVLGEGTAGAVRGWPLEALPPCQVKGRIAPVHAFLLRPDAVGGDHACTAPAAAVADPGPEGGSR